MKKIVFCGLFLAALSLTAQEINSSKLDGLFSLIDEHDKGMGSLSVFSNGEEVYQNAIGYANLEEKKEADERTKYRIGSITKMFTATMLMQLVEEKKLSLDSKLKEFYPELPNADKISIEKLLRHQSGLFNITGEPNHINVKGQPHTKEELLKKFIANGTIFEPGEKSSYSNTNYIILTFILEDLEKRPYAASLNERILKPLNLENTYYGGKIDPAKHEAYSYQKLSSWTLEPESDMSIPRGAGAIVSTPKDLNTFLWGLFNGELIEEGSLLKMQEITKDFGIGMFPVPFFQNEKIIGHTGGIDGFAAMAAYLPERKMAVSFASNGVDWPTNDIMYGILSILLDKDYKMPQLKTLTLTPEQLEPFTGTYGADNFPVKIEIFVENGILMGQGTGQQAFPLDAVEESKFKFDRANLTMEFVPDEDKMIFSQGGNTLDLQRKKKTE